MSEINKTVLYTAPKLSHPFGQPTEGRECVRAGDLRRALGNVPDDAPVWWFGGAETGADGEVTGVNVEHRVTQVVMLDTDDDDSVAVLLMEKVGAKPFGGAW